MVNKESEIINTLSSTWGGGGLPHPYKHFKNGILRKSKKNKPHLKSSFQENMSVMVLSCCHALLSALSLNKSKPDLASI